MRVRQIRTYAFLLHDLPIKLSVTFHFSLISAKNARSTSATGFTQKRHTLYAYYNGWSGKFQMFFAEKIGARLRQVPISVYLTYSITTRRLGSTPVEWVVMFSMSCKAAWITWRS